MAEGQQRAEEGEDGEEQVAGRQLRGATEGRCSGKDGVWLISGNSQITDIPFTTSCACLSEKVKMINTLNSKLKIQNTLSFSMILSYLGVHHY